MKIKKEFLQSHALFGGITDADIEQIIPLLKEETFDKGAFIIREDEDGDMLHFIIEGSVEVVKRTHDDKEDSYQKLAIFGPGDTFGEMELIDIQKRSASVRALEDVSALTLSNKDMYKLYHSNLKAYTMIIMNIAREISRRLRNMDRFLDRSLHLGPK
jgi:CRP/FNR family cyclic AMP-dependent transcriptional regulator